MTITAPTTDPGMTLVSAWVDALLPTVERTLSSTPGAHGQVPFTAFATTNVNRADAIFRCAVAIAARRLAPNPFRFFAWFASLCWNEQLDPVVTLQMRVPLFVNLGTPSEPSSDDHLLGLVAETLWFELATSWPTPQGLPILVEGHDWSVTDPGGDGLAIYRDGADLSFTLWESKAHRAQHAVRTTVNGACRQLRSHAPDYLGRFSIVAQRVAPDDETARFLCLMSEHWADKSTNARVAVSIAASSTSNDLDCFKSMTRYFGFEAARHSGRLFRISDFVDFAHEVRTLVWRGAGL